MKTQNESGQTSPSAAVRGTCAWCHRDFTTVSDLLTHADDHS
jgi:hypothetical protein